MKSLFVLLVACASQIAPLAAQTGLVPAWVEKDAPELKAKYPALHLITYHDAAEAKAHAAEAEGIIGTSSADFLEAAPKLRWVHNYSAGAHIIWGHNGPVDGNALRARILDHIRHYYKP